MGERDSERQHVRASMSQREWEEKEPMSLRVTVSLLSVSPPSPLLLSLTGGRERSHGDADRPHLAHAPAVNSVCACVCVCRGGGWGGGMYVCV